jgi:two-component sensor histidine kinase
MLKVISSLLLLLVNVYAGGFELSEQTNLLFFGAFAMIIIYNLGHYVISQSATYASYFLFHLFVFVIMLFFTGIFNDTLLEFTLHGVSVGWFFLATASLVAFSRDFLNLKVLYPRLIPLVNGLIVINLGFLALSAFAMSNIYLENLAIAFVILIATGLLLFSAYLSLIKKQITAKFYFFAFSFLFVNIVSVFLTHFGLLSLSPYATAFFEIGILIEASIFSFALAYQHREHLLKLKQNELLFKELSHRVQNNLQQIISILTLQIGSVEELETKGYLQDTINRISAISLIHKTLQHSKNVGKVNMYTYLQALIKGYQGLNSKVIFDFNCDKNLQLEIEKLTPLALILNELITNSIKHAFKETPSPQIRLSLEEHSQLTFTYKDNGSGFKEGSVTTSLGTKLINILSTNQLKGTTNTDSNAHYFFSLNFSR